MNVTDKLKFSDLMNGLSDYYQQKSGLSDFALTLYFTALSDYTMEQIREAVTTHIKLARNGQFYPKASDLIALIDGGGINHDQVIASARLADTPFGILCAIQIGSWDLKNQTDMFYLKQRAEECLLLLPEWKRRALSGDYTDQEISIMLKHGVNPCQPFTNALPRPKAEVARLIENKISEVSKTDRHNFLIGKIEPENHLRIEYKPEDAIATDGEIQETKKMIADLVLVENKYQNKKAILGDVQENE